MMEKIIAQMEIVHHILGNSLFVEALKLLCLEQLLCIAGKLMI